MQVDVSLTTALHNNIRTVKRKYFVTVWLFVDMVTAFWKDKNAWVRRWKLFRNNANHVCINKTITSVTLFHTFASNFTHTQHQERRSVYFSVSLALAFWSTSRVERVPASESFASYSINMLILMKMFFSLWKV